VSSVGIGGAAVTMIAPIVAARMKRANTNEETLSVVDFIKGILPRQN
jgi:hypothetical protein